jgi:hypothetical protein
VVTGLDEAAENWIEPLLAVFGKEPKAAPGVILTSVKLAAEYDKTDCTVLIEVPLGSMVMAITIFEPVVTLWLAGERYKRVPAAAWMGRVWLSKGKAAMTATKIIKLKYHRLLAIITHQDA